MYLNILWNILRNWFYFIPPVAWGARRLSAPCVLASVALFYRQPTLLHGRCPHSNPQFIWRYQTTPALFVAVIVLPQTFCFLSVQFSRSVVSDSATPWITARQASLSITSSRSPPKPMSIELVMPSSHLILCHPLLLPPILPSIKVFSNESNSSHEVAKVLEFQLQHQPFQWTPRTNGLVGSPCSPRDSQESSPTPHFKSINSLGLSFLHSKYNSHIHTWPLKKPQPWLDGPLLAK